VLLAEVGNIKAAGKSFSDKKKVLEKSDLLTTKAAAKHSTWDRQNIDHHQAYLAKLAVSTWRFDVSLSEVMQAALKPKQQEKKL
jgi:phage repressor protein C with HTH and peptisase S24 domain